MNIELCNNTSPHGNWACIRPLDHAGSHENVTGVYGWPNLLMPPKQLPLGREILDELNAFALDPDLYRKAARADRGSDGHLTEYTRGFRAGLQHAAFETYLVGCPD